MRLIEARSNEVIAKWLVYFGSIDYFC